ncbi:hypothetical protein [Desulfovibrio sp. Fe33]|uniref:hypothetical protein n=1 Tax=Desulfovibrio sp. Fe33 TaxID=3020842 RepID=UPI00234C0681|nr:hypothetical protein [Desulfovibrio sp. Fe33]
MVKTLYQQPHYDTGKPIFATIRGLMRFAATLGYDQGERKSLDSDINESDGRPFARHDQTFDLMLLLALAETKSSDIFLSDDDEQLITIFEEYAQAGFEILERWLKARPDDLYGDQSILNGLATLGYIDERAASTIDDVSESVEF